MPSYEEVKSQVERIDSNAASPLELRELPNHLLSGEHILNLVRGQYRNEPGKAPSDGLLIATNFRLFFFTKRTLDKALILTFPYEQVSTVHHEIGGFTDNYRGTITIVGPGISQVISQVQKNRTIDFCDTVLSQLSASRASSMPTPGPIPGQSATENKIAQLERLAKLKEQGILTEAEFVAEKRQIMGTTSGTAPQKPQGKKRPSHLAANVSLPAAQVPIVNDETDTPPPDNWQEAQPGGRDVLSPIDYDTEEVPRWAGEEYYPPDITMQNVTMAVKYNYGKILAILLVLLAAMFLAVVSNPNKGQGVSEELAAGNIASQGSTTGNSSQENALNVPPTSTQIPTATLSAEDVAAATQTASASVAGNRPTSKNYFYADATSHSVDAFGDAYASLGGVAALGYPITEAFIEPSSVDGKSYWVQYFEKGELEYHPSESAANQYQLSSLGTWRFKQKYASGTPPMKPVPGEGGYKFPETNHAVSGAFLKYWHTNGEVKRFGYPISESFEEKSDADGKTYLVQYFERAVMEYHPELKAPGNVLLSALGSQKLKQSYAAGVPSGASKPVPSPTANAAATAEAVANVTATAQRMAANATSTVFVKQSEANATATARVRGSYKSTAPKGDFGTSGSVAVACGYLEYRRSFGYYTANSNSKFLTMSVSVTNHTGDSLYVNPNDFTIVGLDGYSVDYDTSTYSFERPFPGVNLQPEGYASGGLSFLVPSDFVPAKLVWRDIFKTVTVTIVGGY